MLSGKYAKNNVLLWPVRFISPRPFVLSSSSLSCLFTTSDFLTFLPGAKLMKLIRFTETVPESAETDSVGKYLFLLLLLLLLLLLRAQHCTALHSAALHCNVVLLYSYSG